MPKRRRNLKPELDAAAAADLKRSKAEESETEDSEVEDAEASFKMQKKKRKPDGEGVMSEKTPKKLKKADGEGVMPEKTPRKRKADCEGVMLKETPVVDRFGFCTEDGHKYLDDTAPSDFHDSFHFNEGKQSELGNKYFSVRWAHLRGRSKKDGALYSSPSIFLLRDWQPSKPISFTLPDKHVTSLRKFLQEVEQEKMSALIYMDQ